MVFRNSFDSSSRFQSFGAIVSLGSLGCIASVHSQNRILEPLVQFPTEFLQLAMNMETHRDENLNPDDEYSNPDVRIYKPRCTYTYTQMHENLSPDGPIFRRIYKPRWTIIQTQMDEYLSTDGRIFKPRWTII